MLDVGPNDHAHEVGKGVEPADTNSLLRLNIKRSHIGGEYRSGVTLLIIDLIYDLDDSTFGLNLLNC